MKPTAFEDASDKGLSVNRMSYVGLEAVRVMAEARAQYWNAQFPSKVQRTLVGYSDFSAKEVRSILTAVPAPHRALAIYDTAKPDYLSHADVCQIVSSGQGGRSARSQMRELANGRLTTF